MNKKVSRVSPQKIKVGLIIFCLFWGGLSIYFIGHSIFGKNEPVIKTNPMIIPKHIPQSIDEKTDSMINWETYSQIKAFKKYMDSTGQVTPPGLLDSMNVLEQIYLSQQKQ